MRPAVEAMLHNVYDHPNAAPVKAMFERPLNYVSAKLPARAESLDAARADLLAFIALAKRCGPDLVQQPHRTAKQEDPPTDRPRTRSSVLSARSWPNRPMNGLMHAAASASLSSPAANTPSSPTPEI